MGLFGSSTKTYWSSTSAQLYADMPPITQQTAAAAILQNRNIATDLYTNLVNGVYWNAGRLYNYALSGDYVYGLPEGNSTVMSEQLTSYTKLAIEADVGEPVYLHWAIYDTDPTTGNILYKAEYSLFDRLGNPTSTTYSWVYDESTDRYPLLTLPKSDEHVTSPYYPIIPVRVNGVRMTDDPSVPVDTQESIRVASRYIGIDVADINDSMESSTTDGYDVADDAYAMLGVEITNQTSVGLEYLFRFFDYMEKNTTITEEDFDYWNANSVSGTPPMNNVRIADSNYAMEIGWLYTVRAELNGTLTEDYTSEYFPFGEIPSGATGYTYSNDTYVIRRKVDDTTYEQLTVHGLVHSNWALGHELRTTLSAAFDDPDVSQSFIIPLRRDICEGALTTRLHDLMYQAIRLVVNDVQKVKLKWYQTGFFRFFTLVVSFALSIFYPPLGIAALSASAVGIAVVQVIAIKVLAPIVYKALEDLVGEELAILISVLAVAYGTGNTVGAVQRGSQAYLTQSYATQTAAYQEELGAIQEDIEEAEETAQQRQEDILFVSKATSGDPYAILQPQNHVKQFFYQHKEPTLIRDTTHRYTPMARFTDIPDSYIRLGHDEFY